MVMVLGVSVGALFPRRLPPVQGIAQVSNATRDPFWVTVKEIVRAFIDWSEVCSRK